MTPDELAAIRERTRGRGPGHDAYEVTIDCLLAHLDAITAKVEGLPYSPYVNSAEANNGWREARAAVLAILRGEE